MTQYPGTAAMDFTPPNQIPVVVPKIEPSGTPLRPVSSLDLGVISALLALLALLLARIVHMLLHDHLAARHLRPRIVDGGYLHNRRLSDIRLEDQCYHDISSAQTHGSHGQQPESCISYMTAAATIASDAVDMAGCAARQSFQAMKSFGDTAAGLNQVCSSELERVQDEEAGYYSCESSGSDTEIEEPCPHRPRRVRKGSSFRTE